MGNDQIINILLKLKGEIDQSVKQLKGNLNDVDKSADKAGKTLNQTFRSSIQPVRSFFRTVSMYSFVFTATMGTMIKSVVDFGKTLDSLDKTSASLGMSTEDLSKKIYGFNLATEQARTGTRSINNVLQEAKDWWTKLGFAISTATNEYELNQKRIQMGGQGKSRNLLQGISAVIPIPALGQMVDYVLGKTSGISKEQAQKSLTEQTQARKANTEEAYQIEADFHSQVLKLQNKDVEALKISLDAQRRLYVNNFGEDSPIVKTYDEFAKLQLDKQWLATYGLKTATQNMQDTWKSAVNNMRSAFSDGFYNIFTGQLNDMQEVFTQFGQGILRTFSNMLSEMASQWAVSGLTNIFSSLFGDSAGYNYMSMPSSGYEGEWSGVTYHKGGIVRAHNGLAIDEVPIIAQRGERVLSRSQNAEYEKGMSGSKPVYVFIQAWDTTDIMRNRKSIEGIIANAIATRGALRGSIKNA